MLTQLLWNRPVRGGKPAKRSRLFLETLEDRCTPSAVSWDGGGDGHSWNDPINWSTDEIPDSNSQVLIVSNITVDAQGAIAIASLDSDASLSINGSLSLAAASVVHGNFALTGTLDLPLGASLALDGGGTLNGTVIGDGPDTGVGGNGGDLEFVDGAYTIADGSVLSVHIKVDEPAVVATNGSVQADGSIFTNDGIVVVQTGTLLLGNGASTGLFEVTAGATLNFDQGTFAANDGTDYTGGGEVVFSGQNLNQQIIVTGAVTARTFVRMEAGDEITGTGTLLITRQLTWHGGRMTGTGVTQIGADAVATVDHPTQVVTLAERTLVNLGTINWLGGNTESNYWDMRGTLLNKKDFNISPAAGRTALMRGNLNVFTNTSQGVIRQTAGPAVSVRYLVFNNDGAVVVQQGQLSFVGIYGTTTGYFQAYTGSQVTFAGSSAGSVYALEPPNVDAGYMLRGGGMFTVGDAGPEVMYLVITDATIRADNFTLRQSGQLQFDNATFTAAVFNWTGGTIVTPIIASGPGVVVIDTNGHMYIEGSADKTLDRCTIRNSGAIDWGLANYNPNWILVSNGAQIDNNGGRFDAWRDTSIVNDVDNPGQSFLVRNGARFTRHIDVDGGILTIRVGFRNEGGP